MSSIVPFARQFKQQLVQSDTASGLLDPTEVQSACLAVGYHGRRCFWNPAVTILTFLRQVLAGNCSCRQAVAATLAHSADSEDWVSGDPSAYSQARQRLPLALLEQMGRGAVQRVAQATSGPAALWRGRPVVVADGACVQTPDTPALQKSFPQPKAQKPGCGFPVIRLVVLFCWASGAWLERAMGSLHDGELKLFRGLLDTLAAGTVVVADRCFSGYYDLCLLSQRGLDAVMRLHQRRPTDLRRGKRLGKGDHLITWTKPPKAPRGVSATAWVAVPATVTLRHVRAEIRTPGFRVRQLDVVTTLRDTTAFPPEALTDLYRDRWMVEMYQPCCLHSLYFYPITGRDLGTCNAAA